MNLSSHGFGSDLLSHLREVMEAATCLEEKIIMACHDIAKATIPWQEWINQEKKAGQSPHPHALAGGILAAAIILLLEKQKKPAQNTISWSLVALHAGAAHHTNLQEIRVDLSTLKDLRSISKDEQAKTFFLDDQHGIASLLPEIPSHIFQQAWEKLSLLAEIGGEERQGWTCLFKSLPAETLLHTYLRGRGCLGRLCLFDHFSAAKQSGKEIDMPAYDQAVENIPFTLRAKRIYPNSGETIHQLRSSLKTSFLQIVEQDSTFYLIDAPTGLGKTETMLSAAEKIRYNNSLQHIVFTVPQVSIADQIFEEYFATRANAQIWNYRRQEKTEDASSETSSHSYNASYDDANALLVEQHPFSHSYNVTTFNQLLLAMFHPHRQRCIRGLGLNNAVIIMDEFHKLPLTILPLFFRFAKKFAEQANCRFILGSATPISLLPYWGLDPDIPQLPKELSERIYKDEEIDARRYYRNIGEQPIDEIIKKIETIHETSDENLLVVVNLVAKGSWPLQRHFRQRWNPWKQIEELDEDSAQRLIICLDGLMPPALRRTLICKCKEVMTLKKRPITLITTQMIEVGVDLDFDRALIDYQGIAATIQRGGRTGREGRKHTCSVDVFSLVTTAATTSFEELNEVEKENSQRNQVEPFPTIQGCVDQLRKKEKQFFSTKWGDRMLKDSELVEELKTIQEKSFGSERYDTLVEKFLPIFNQKERLGATFENTQFIAELFDDDHKLEIVVLKNGDDTAKLIKLANKIKSIQSSKEERKQYFQFISDYKISLNPKILSELYLGEPCGVLPPPDEGIRVFQKESNIL